MVKFIWIIFCLQTVQLIIDILLQFQLHIMNYMHCHSLTQGILFYLHYNSYSMVWDVVPIFHLLVIAFIKKIIYQVILA